MNESQKPGISHTPKEGVQQEKLKEEIVGHIRKGEELLDTYIQQATRETLQHALKQGLVECIEKGQWLSKKYTELTDAETWNSIKANNQEEIKRGFVVRIKEGGDFPRNLLDLATEETLDYIKSNHQEEVRQGIIAYVARRSGILALYLKLANEDTLQSAVKQSILNGLVSGECLTERFLDLLSENSRNEIKESHEQEVIEGIASSVKKGVKVPEKYLELTTGDHLQTALAHWLPAKIGRGESIPKKYLEIASEEVLASIRANHQKEIERGIGHCVWSGKNIPKYLKDLATEESVQAGLCYGFTHYARTGVAIPEYYLKLATPATIQSSMHIFLVGGMKSAIPDISPSYAKLATPETMQSALREVFLDCMKSEKNMSPALHAKITKESYEIIKKEHQIDIQQAIMWWYVQKKSGWPTEYMNLATKETVQAALKQAFVHYVKDNRRIPVEYLDMATDETLEAVLVLAFFESLQKGGDLSQKYIGHFVKQGNLQQFAQGVLLKTAQEGRHIPRRHSDLISEETLSIFEDEAVVREAAFQLTGSFFNNPKEMESEIRELLSQKDSDWIKRLVFDRTLLSVGVKIHTHKRELGVALKKTGGFVAHGKDTCFVANPIPNKFVLEIAMEALKNKINGLEEEAFFQTCVPKRLSNECCGIATIAFLLTKTNNVKYDQSVLQHNQAAGLTIYDAEGFFEDKFYVPKAARDDDRKVAFDGRTDIVLCTTIKDIENAHLLLSLLVHASYEPQELRFKALGQQFISEFKAILERHRHTDWLQRNFVNASVDDVGKILLNIAEHREEVSKMIIQYNAGVTLYSQEVGSESEANLEEIRRQVESMKKNIDNSFWFDIKGLIERYENQLYPDGMYINSLTGEYS